MQSWRTGAGLVGAAVPVIYCCGFLWYFLDMGGWDSPVVSQGLRPTIVGLGIVGLLFSIGLGLKIRRAFKGPKPPAQGGGAGKPLAVAPGGDDAGGAADADAMIARYLAQRAAAGSPSPQPPASSSGKAGVTFGRRGR